MSSHLSILLSCANPHIELSQIQFRIDSSSYLDLSLVLNGERGFVLQVEDFCVVDFQEYQGLGIGHSRGIVDSEEILSSSRSVQLESGQFSPIDHFCLHQLISKHQEDVVIELREVHMGANEDHSLNTDLGLIDENL